MSADLTARRSAGRGAAGGEPRLSRRALGWRAAALASSAALVTVGCDTDDPLDLPGRPGAEEEPDHDRVLAGLRDEQSVLDQVRRVRRRHPALRRALAPTVAVHQAHVDLLSRGVDESEVDASGAGGRGRVPADPAKAVARLVRLERSLADRHVATAMRSRSGTLARAVASMSAAAAQQAVVLAPLAAREREQGS